MEWRWGEGRGGDGRESLESERLNGLMEKSTGWCQWRARNEDEGRWVVTWLIKCKN